ncbi:MAG: hypothetical protein M1160_01215 [Candidatus Marsarchaeota archaeon]|jgi:hypothetical protein|nr:hypothetical protein [Candidatus Marsarchaeota archaeon]MCL5111486.1 hypothetical protein [Candidatus Marsarchaeota archaeon]
MATKFFIIAIATALIATISVSYAALPQFPVTPYSNATQVGYHVVNISTYGYFDAVIGQRSFNTTQNFISPNESGVTINNVSYDLYPGKPVLIVGTNNSYMMLVRVNYIPRQHTVNFNIYSLQPTTTTTTSTTSSQSSTVLTVLTTVPTTALTTSVNQTTTIAAQPSGNQTGNFIARLIAAIKSFLSKL